MDFTSTIVRANTSGPITDNIQSIVSTNVDEVIYVNIHVRRPESITDYANSIIAFGLPTLSNEQYTKKFGAADSDLDLIVQFAEHYNLTILGRYVDAAKVQLSGTVGLFNQAFNIQLNNYTNNTETYRSFSDNLTIPTELDDVIVSVIGLDNYSKDKLFRCFGPTLDPAQVDEGIVPAGAIAGSEFLTPQRVSTAYNFPQSQRGYAFNGHGRTIGIISFDGGWTQQNIDSSFSNIGLQSPNVKDVLLLGQTNDINDPAATEVMLDIFLTAGIAPKANIVNYMAPNGSGNYVDLFDYILSDTENNPDVISISWIYIELGVLLFYTDNGVFAAINERLASCAVKGITVIAASGDWGAQAGPYGGAYPATIGTLASSPYVLAAGGTSLLLHANNKIKLETTWNHDGSATGGGVSILYGLPSYQNNLTVSYFPVLNSAPLTVRGIPDISGNADSATGYRFFYGPLNTFIQVGGTSATAPMIAGMIAILNQLSGKRMGFCHQLFYSNPHCFNDITTGNIGFYAANTQLPAYRASAGWDACTGLGTIKGNAIYQLIRTDEVYPKKNYGVRPKDGHVYPRVSRR
jgi:kumamolisin